MEIVACTAAHPLPDGEVRLLGAVDTVTGAMTKVTSGGATLLVDCGVAQGREARRWRFPEAARDVDAVILTHGHNDHVGSLPTLLEGGFEGPILATRATWEVAKIVLKDGIRIQGGSGRDVKAFLDHFDRLFRPLRYDQPEAAVPGFDGMITLREAGHILGSSSVELWSPQSRVIVSGDLGRPESPILRDPNTTWSDHRPVDLVVMECTYGDRDHKHSADDVRDNLERTIRHALRDGGHILVPAFSIGRTQVLLYHLNDLVESGRLPDLKVAVDSPMGVRVTETHQDYRKLFDREALDRIAHGDDPLDFDTLFAVRRHRDSLRLRELDESFFIISSSGMCTGGRIVGHLIDLLPRPETAVIFTGYQAHGTPGRAIQRAARQRAERGGVPTVEIDGQSVDVRAEVTTLSGLSAHAGKTELRAWLGAIPDVRRVALHHGERDAQQVFASGASRL